jgi:hypothetical protein
LCFSFTNPGGRELEREKKERKRKRKKQQVGWGFLILLPAVSS